MRLGLGEVYRRLGPVDLEPVLRVMGRLEFVSVGQSAGKYPCDVVLAAHFPLEIHDLIDSLDLGGRRGRAVLRRLAPRQDIPVHVDDWMPAEVDWRRFQVPLVSDPGIRMRWPDDGVGVYLEPGWLYEVAFTRPHEVLNNADTERIHLQVDQVDATI